eukprot:TRINITY_DN6621_c0_g1_i1.p1 TRINITY_DN6621_c0_g1~~TRINITY_DN6621_c0_g1_i1.p1  ORF type:complete len:460 (-),score=92.31 TRINITY_DN6621_c0_g1_i1:83-1270(-)
MDSMVSSILLARLRHAQHSARLYVPLINIPRDDFSLRTEAVWLFKKAGVDVSALVFLDELDLHTVAAKYKLHILLVDHNQLGSAQEWLAPYVEEIIDHHAAQNLYKSTLKHTVVEPTGSACTLVAEEILEHHKNATPPDSSSNVLDQQTALLLLGTILIDTVNFSPSSGRFNAKDEHVADNLYSAILSSSSSSTRPPLTRDALFTELQNEKFNVLGLSARDLLRKDYKEWTFPFPKLRVTPEVEQQTSSAIKVGISSAGIDLRVWVERDGSQWAGSLDAWAQERRLDLLLLMLAFQSESAGFRRQLVVYRPTVTATAAVAEALCGFLEGRDDLKLQPIAVELQASGISSSSSSSSSRTGVWAYEQGNAKASRKVIQPILAVDFFGVQPSQNSADT